MAATALAVQGVPHTGLLPAVYSTPTQTTGHTCPCGPDMVLVVKLASGGPTNVDLHIPGTVDGVAVATPSGAAAPSRRVACVIGDNFIPVPAEVYADPTTGLCTFDIAATANLTFACVRIA
jgi:hypothetical protein